MLQPKVLFKWKIGLVIVLMVFAACQRINKSSAPGITIAGKLKGEGNAMIWLSELDVKVVKPIDSVRIGKDGKFSFELIPKGNSFYLLTLPHAQKLILVADSGDNIYIEGDGKKILRTASIKGSIASALLLDFDRFSSHNQAKADSLAKIFMNSRSDPGFAGIRQRLDSGYAEIVSRQKQMTATASAIWRVNQLS